MIDSVMLTEKIPDYFSPFEFRACSPSCKKSDMDAKFLMKLNSCRYLVGSYFVLNSAYRSPAWDKSKGRSGTGYHTKGRAVDIRCSDSFTRGKIVQAAISCGLNGIGIAKNYIHLDDRDFLTIWLYE